MAIEIEQNLEFVGVIGVRDIVRPEARQLIQRLKGTGIAISVFTGDSLAQTSSVCKALHLCHPNFNDNSHFYWIKGSGPEILNCISRIIESIYSDLK